MNLKSMLMATAVMVAVSSPSFAQRRLSTTEQLNQRQLDVIAADDFARGQATANVNPDVVTPTPVNLNLSGFYVGINGGSTFESNSDFTIGGLVGYQLTPNFAAELAYDFNQRSNQDNGQLLMVNAVAGYPMFNNRVTPYALAGLGAGFDYFGNSNGNAETVYNVGGGVRINLVSSVDLDVRYRYVSTFNDGNDANMLTGGLTFRF